MPPGELVLWYAFDRLEPRDNGWVQSATIASEVRATLTHKYDALWKFYPHLYVPKVQQDPKVMRANVQKSIRQAEKAKERRSSK